MISILLPALNKAREAANTVKCLSNLRSIMQAQQIYAAQWNGAIAGAPVNTARFMFNSNLTGLTTTLPDGTTMGANDFPTVVSDFDWQGPLMRVMGIPDLQNDSGYVVGNTPHLNSGADSASRLSRWEAERTYGTFVCPDNNALVAPYSSSVPLPPTETANSYVMSAFFLLIQASGAAQSAIGSGNWYKMRCIAYLPQTINAPDGYYPRFSSVRNSAYKIAVCDALRYTTGAAYPDINLQYNGAASSSAQCCDMGAFSTYTEGLVRRYPGNPNGYTGSMLFDPRPLQFRHGSQLPNKTAGNYKLNAAFYDGHAETLDDLTASDPRYWVPSGTVLEASGYGAFGDSAYGGMWADTAAKYGYVAAGGPGNVVP